MPNWTSNDVTIKGEAEQLNELLSVIQNNDETIRLININPVPEIFSGLQSGSRNINGKKYSLWIEQEGKEPIGLDENEVSKIMKLTGASDSIDWQYKNWGTKWGDCDTHLIKKQKYELHIYFESAWGEPFLLLDDIANKFNVSIENIWQVEFDQDNGKSIYPLNPLERMEIDNTYAKSLDDNKAKIEEMLKNKQIEIETGSFDDFFNKSEEE